MNVKPKVKAAGAGGAVGTIAVWVAAQFGLDMPPGVGEAIAVVLAVAAGWLKSDNS